MRAPASIGRYKLLRRVGAGGMGVVYEAIDSRDETRVALKVLLPHAAEEAEGIARFKREFRALARLRHPNIVRVHDAGIEDDTPFIAMEFLEGKDARSYLHSFPEGPVRDREIVQIFRQILGALAHIHARKIVHRDLKPENILVSKDGRVSLMDFGVARLLRSPSTSSGLLGTFAYMAPEQVVTGEIDGRSDLYAIGIVLYEILTSRYPFPVEPPAAALHHHVHTLPEPIHRINPAVDDALVELTHHLLEKDPVERIQSAEEAINHLAQVKAAAPGTADMSASVPGMLFAPRMVGREEEASLLQSHVERAASGRGRLILLEGPSGVGKTRLVDELKHELGRQAYVVIGQCAPERSQPYGALAAVLDLIATIAERAPKDVQQRILGRDVALVGAVSPRLARQGSPATTDHLDASERKVRLHKAMVGVIGRLSLVKPVVMVVEDLHWADTLTLELLWDATRTLLAPRPGGEQEETVCPVAIVLTRRSLAEGPDHSEALIRKLETRTPLERITIEPIDSDAVAEMVRTMTAIKNPAPVLIDELIEFSHGLPLMVQELLHSWLNEDVLARQHGVWLFRGQPAELGEDIDDTDRGKAVSGVPSSIRPSSKRPARHDLVLNKLSKISSPARGLLEKLALLGRVLPWDLVRKLAGLDEPALLDLIDELVRADLLVESVTREGAQYRFYHEGFREALVRELPNDKRRALHLGLARRLEKFFIERRIELAHVLARHFRQAGVPERAVRYLRLIAKNGAAHGDLDGALKRLDEALAILDEAPNTPARNTRRLRVVCLQIDILLDYGRAKEALERADPRAAVASRSMDVMEGELLLRRSSAQFALGKLDEALATLGRMPRPAPTRSLGARALKLEGKTRMARGQYIKARTVLEAARDIADEAGLDALSEELRAKIGVVMLHQGDYLRSKDKLEQALETARSQKRSRTVAELIGYIGMVHFARRNATQALSCYREALEIAEARGVRSDRERWTGSLGVLMADMGDVEGARARLHEALTIAQETGNRQGEATWLGELGAIELEEGEESEALQHLNRCLAIARDIGFLRYEAWALIHLGALALETDVELNVAADRITEGLEIAADIGSEEIHILGLLYTGRLSGLEGDPEGAHEHLEEALRVAQTSGNARLQVRVEAELARQGQS